MNKLPLLLVAVVLLASACTKEESPDVTKPVITAATDHLDTRPDTTFNLQATITDDQALAAWKIDIHSADGHSHRVLSGEWEYSETGTIEGNSYVLNKTITVPVDAALGDYHLTIDATDRAGNAANSVIIDLHIE